MRYKTSRKGIGGRPKKKPSAKQSKRAMVTFTPSEYRKVKDAAGDDALGAFIRRVVLRYLARRK